MLSVKEAQERILERISVLDPLELSVTDAHGAVLAETVTAPEDLPPHPSAAIDGFALRSEDTATAGETPVSLTIIGEAASGRPFAGRLTRGEAVRVFGGAALPEGADAVMRREDVAVVGSSMAIGRMVRMGDNVRPAGEDIKRGDPVMQEGQRVRGMDVGVLAAMGRSRVLIRPRPRVVTFSAGNELRDPGQPLGAGFVRDSNSFAIAGMTREAGAEPTRAGIVPNDADSLKEKFQSYLPQADVFITSGGIAEGDEAHLRSVAEDLGHLNVWQIATSPPTTLAFGTVAERTFFGLSSNPVVAVVTFELFVRPALLKMAGRQTLYRPEIEAALEQPVDIDSGRETYVRVRAWRDESGWRARPAGRQGPSVISSVAGANAFAVVPGDKPLASGQRVRVILLEPLEGW
jgi:molybdopterin molybdotransferase